MSREEGLQWIGIALGLPSFLLLFFTDRVVVGILVLALALGLIGASVWLRWRLNQPDFTVLDSHQTLIFNDEYAHKVSYSDVRKAQANHRGLTEFWFRGLAGDGSIQNVLIDGRLPDIEQTRAGLREICRRLPDSSESGHEYRMTASMDLMDSFPESIEFHTRKISDRTKKFRVTVQFHPDKRCNSARAYLQYGSAKHKPLKESNRAKLTRSDDGLEVELEVRKPKRGLEYRLE